MVAAATEVFLFIIIFIFLKMSPISAWGNRCRGRFDEEEDEDDEEDCALFARRLLP
jgi:hypothetical protein